MRGAKSGHTPFGSSSYPTATVGRMEPAHFPRGRVFARVRFKTTGLLSAVPIGFAAPATGAVVAAFLAPSHPSATVRVLWALIGAVGGLGAFGLLGWVVFWLHYRLLGDRLWQVAVAPLRNGIVQVHLFPRRTPPAEKATELGRLQVSVRRPSGRFYHAGEGYDAGVELSDVWARFLLPTPSEPPGFYEVRWYATRGRRYYHEVTRGRFRITEEGELIVLRRRVDEFRLRGRALNGRLRAALRGMRGSSGRREAEPERDPEHVVEEGSTRA